VLRPAVSDGLPASGAARLYTLNAARRHRHGMVIDVVAASADWHKTGSCGQRRPTCLQPTLAAAASFNPRGPDAYAHSSCILLGFKGAG
jgi:hypothetical protein